MRTFIKNTGHYTLLLTLLLGSLVAFSQNSKPTQFKDFPIISNLDSFEQVIRQHKNNSEQYLYDLITLEKNREDYIGWFGQDLPTIEMLADKLRSPLGIACYHYFQGLKLRGQMVNSATRNLLEAIHYFETAHDTTGIMKSYYAMLLVSPYLGVYKINNLKDRNYYFDRIMALSQKSSDMKLKFIRIYAISFFEKTIKGKQDYNERIGEIEETLSILDKNPRVQPAYAQLYVGISSFYLRHDFSPLAFKYQLKSYELFKKISSKICIKNYLNVGTAYFNKEAYTEAEPILQQGIQAMQQLKDNEKDNNILMNLYIILSEIQFSKKDYESAHKSSVKAIEIQNIQLRSAQISLFEELQTQSEIDQKETENALLLKKNELAEIKNQQLEQNIEMNTLIQKNQSIENQNLQYQKDAENYSLMQKNQSIQASVKQYMNALIAVIVSLVIVSTLIYFLYKLNTQQKQLILFRDQLFAIIAHDMRTPLTAFKGFSEGVSFLLKKGEYDNIRVLSQSIDQLIFNTNLLFDNLLNWYALQRTNTKTNKNTFSVHELVKESADLYAAIAKNRKLSIEIAIPDALTIYANRNALLLILRNLIDNAIKHGKSKKNSHKCPFRSQSSHH